MTLLLTYVLLGPSSWAEAADPQLITKQIAVLQQQVAFLQKELNSLKGVVSVSPDGTIRITAQKHKQEVTGGNQQVDIEGNFTLRLGGSSAKAVGGSQSITVGTNQTESIGQDQVQKIGRNMFQNAGLDVNIEAGKRTIISAGDQLILRTGQASIVLNKNGNITIQGQNIQIKGSACHHQGLKNNHQLDQGYTQAKTLTHNNIVWTCPVLMKGHDSCNPFPPQHQNTPRQHPKAVKNFSQRQLSARVAFWPLDFLFRADNHDPLGPPRNPNQRPSVTP